MINKNFYRKTNDKKILHKVGKQWKVISTALLLAVAGGAVAATTNANAAQTSNDLDNTSVNTLVGELNTSSEANAPRSNARPSSASASSATSSSATSIEYYSGNNGSAAKYFDKVDQDNATISKYSATVNAYVQSLNDEYNPQVRSLATISNSARTNASNDSKLANSYSAIANKNTTMSTIDSLAAARNITPTLYQGMVQDQEQAYSGAVNSASNDVKANSDVASLANRLEGINFTSASMSASASDIVANSNYVGALANYNSVVNMYGGNVKPGDYANVASALSYGSIELFADGNNVNYNANISALSKIDGVNGGSVTSEFNSDVASAYTSASNVLSTSASQHNLAAYVAPVDTKGHTLYNSDLVKPVSAAALNNVTGLRNTASLNSANSNFYAAVSAATDERFSPVLGSVANSIAATYGQSYAAYNATSKEASAAIASASAGLRAAQYAQDFASANSSVVDKLSGFATGDHFTSAFINEGVNSFENDLGIMSSNADYSKRAKGYTTIDNAESYLSNVNSKAATSNQGDLDVLTDFYNFYKSNNTSDVEQDFVAYLNAHKDEFSSSSINITDNGQFKDNAGSGNASDKYNDKLGKNPDVRAVLNSITINGSNGQKDTSLTNDVIKALEYNNNKLFTDALTANSNTQFAQNTTRSALVSTIKNISAILDTENGQADNITPKRGTGLTGHQGQLLHPGELAYNPDTTEFSNGDATSAHATDLNEDLGTNYDFGVAALLSAGVNLKALENESGAINNVASAVNSANVNLTNVKGDTKLNDALGVAASSANSASGSAQNASAEYSAANDEDVTLANYFAGSYASQANSQSDIASSASSSLDNFFRSTAHDDAFTNADDIYNSAAAAATNDYKLGVANAQSIYNSNAHFLDVTKGARLHSTPHFGSKKFNDKVVGSVKVGDRLTVHGVNVSRNGNIRGVIRYYVTDNTTGAKGFFTGQPNYSKAAYLNATAADANVNIKTLKPVNVYAGINDKKAIGTVPAGKVLENATVVYDNDARDAYGFTKVQAANGDFFTANTDYVEILTPTVNTNNNAPQSNFSNFNLNGGQKMADYYNNLSQD